MIGRIVISPAVKKVNIETGPASNADHAGFVRDHRSQMQNAKPARQSGTSSTGTSAKAFMMPA